jgi:hypothetical protein
MNLAGGKRGGASVNGAHLRAKARLDTERHERITNHRPRMIPDRGPDYGIGIDEDHASCAIRQHAAKLLRHLRCNFNAGKTRRDLLGGQAARLVRSWARPSFVHHATIPTLCPNKAH